MKYIPYRPPTGPTIHTQTDVRLKSVEQLHPSSYYLSPEYKGPWGFNIHVPVDEDIIKAHVERMCS